MEVFKHIRIGGLHIYISSRRMKRQSNDTGLLARHRGTLKRIKKVLYNQSSGRCECCGCELPIHGLELHHIAPVKERPDLVARMSNLFLLCPECHARLHNRTFTRKAKVLEK